jgi:hypothetical protein
LVAQFLEERVQGGGVFSFGAPHDLLADVVGDQGQVAVVAPPAHLVHADAHQPVQPAGVQTLGHDPLADPPDAVPVDTREPGDGALIGLGRQERDQILEVAAELRAVPSERHGLHPDPCVRHASRRSPLPAAHIGVPPSREHWPGVIAGTGRELAFRALQPAAPQRDIDDELVSLEADRRDAHPSKAEQAVECSCDAHGCPLFGLV